MTDENKNKENESAESQKKEHRFQGNMGEPDTITSFILMYGYNPITQEPETVESFHAKYDIDPKTGKPIPKVKNEK